VAQKVTAGVYKGVTTAELDELAAETAASMTATHPDYALVCFHAAHLTPRMQWCSCIRRASALHAASLPAATITEIRSPPYFRGCRTSTCQTPRPDWIRFIINAVHSCATAGGAHRSIKPAQEHAQVLQRDVRSSHASFSNACVEGVNKMPLSFLLCCVDRSLGHSLHLRCCSALPAASGQDEAHVQPREPEERPAGAAHC